MDTFRYVSYAQEVIFESGSLERLPEVFDRAGWKRVMLCTGSALRQNGKAAAVEALLVERLAASFDRVKPHVQDTQVDEALAAAREKQVDAIIGLGGGSPIGMAKAISYAFEKRGEGDSSAKAVLPHAQPSVPAIAIPTTYAGSEMTAVFGMTESRATPPRKVTVSDPRVAPKLVIYDPELTLDLPPEMTASTGMNALAHCLEALYSLTRNPISSAAAIESARRINRALPCCVANGSDREARSDMLLGAHLAGWSLASVKMALHHGLCHVLGGTANVPHGIANSIMLPYSVRFNARAAAHELLPAAEALGIHPGDGGAQAAVEALAQHIYDLAGQMGLPQRLRDVGVRADDLPRLAQLAFANKTVHNNPRPIESAAQIEAIYREAW